MISLQGISKSFKVAKRSAGMGQAMKALFHREYTVVEALQDISFNINEIDICSVSTLKTARSGDQDKTVAPGIPKGFGCSR